MKIYRIAQTMNLKTNPEVVKSAYRVLEFQEMDEAYGWSEWINFLDLEKNDLPEYMLEEMREDYVASIYGQGGWNRYHVKGDGSVIFSKMHSEEEEAQKAQELGFLVG